MTTKPRVSFDLMTIDRRSAEPIHRQIYAALRRYILDGHVAPHTVLPSTRTLATDLGVGRNTVVAAYDQLFAEGYLVTRSGSGTSVAPLSEKARATRAPAADGEAKLSRRGEVITSRTQPIRHAAMINLHPGVPETASFPFAAWTHLLAEHSRSRDESLLGYLSFAGHQALRQTIASQLALGRGIGCTADQIIIVTGAQAALDLVSRVLMDDGDTVWMEEPGYLGARSAFLAGGARLAPLRVSHQGWDLADPSLPAPRLIYVTPSCQWPFGTIMRVDERLRLLAIAERHKAWIIEDDFEGEYRYRGSPVPALRGFDHAERVIYIGSFGKTLLPSLRIGYLVVPRELSERFDKAVGVTGQFPPLLLQAAVNDFIARGYFARHVRRMRRLYARRQAEFVALCQSELGRWLTVAENDSGMHLFARFTQPLDDAVVVEAARRYGLDVHAVSINYHASQPEHGLMLGFCALDDKAMRRAIGLLKRSFEALEAGVVARTVRHARP
jgi:GntR family transcriptional regulator/MocR family aminotransferase